MLFEIFMFFVNGITSFSNYYRELRKTSVSPSPQNERSNPEAELLAII